MAKKQKYYAVWEGRKTGVYSSWDDCKKQIDGYEGAKYKSFESLAQAESALKQNYFKVVGNTKTPQTSASMPRPKTEAIIVDAAWNTKTGDMEYQGIDYISGRKIFHQGPYYDGTNNIGEFLAIVHALALLDKNKLNTPIYSDSMTAISWVKKQKANTKLDPTPRNKVLFELLERAETWLKSHRYANPILKWETQVWGENPADFGRK